MAEKSQTARGKGEKARSGKKVANSLVTLSSAAVLSIYAAGYARTRSAAEQFEMASAQRRPVVPAPAPAAAPEMVPAPIAAVPVAPTALAAEPSGNPASERSSLVAPAAISATAKPAAPGNVTGDAVMTRVPEPTAKPATLPTADAAPVSAATTAAASAPPAAPAPAAAAPPVKYKDGTYHGWGTSRHGDIYSFVVIEKGRIVHAGYDKCRTRWPCTLVDHLGPQVVKRQSAEVDYISGATESGNAFYWGIVTALSSAKLDALPEPKTDALSEAR